MISEVLQATIGGIITNTNIAVGDEEISTPFCIHTERETPILLKEGIAGYEYDCEVMIIDNLPDSVETLKQQIITALEALERTTNSGIIINAVEYQGDDPGFDQASRLYATVLKFYIETQNR